MNLFPELQVRALQFYEQAHRPWVTLTYAQSLDGSIAVRREGQLELSGDESRLMTHHLRAVHDAILVGIGTVLADDPRLTARLTDGKNPQPVILDSRLRFPLTARLLQSPDRRPWLMTSAEADADRSAALQAAEAKVLEIPTAANHLLDLDAVLDRLGALGIRSLMVEGGARVITNFLKGNLANMLIVTIAPMLVGGLNAIDPALWRDMPLFPRLSDVHSRQAGNDVVVWGDFAPEQA